MKSLVYAGLIGALMVGGFAGCRARVYAPAPEVVITTDPPAAIVETPPPPPSPGYVWINGYYSWDGRVYVWVPGRYEVLPHGHHHWVAHHWERRGNGWVMIEGHWD